METNILKNLQNNVHSSLVPKRQKLEEDQLPINKRMKKHTVTHHPYNEILLMIKRNELLLPAITWINLFIYLSYHLSTCLSSFTYQLCQTSYTTHTCIGIIFFTSRFTTKEKQSKWKQGSIYGKQGRVLLGSILRGNFLELQWSSILINLYILPVYDFFNACLQKSTPMISTFHCM